MTGVRSIHSPRPSDTTRFVSADVVGIGNDIEASEARQSHRVTLNRLTIEDEPEAGSV
jgi:hypothetical protein